jgi:tripartite-type tricarboxylate transporter receptor subunit TctC
MTPISKRLAGFGTALIVAAVTLGGCAESNDQGTDPSNESWAPDGPVSLVVPFGTGGGVDLAGRTIQEILIDQKIVDARIDVENREGGSGLVGMSFVKTKAGSGEVIMVSGRHPITSPLLQETDVSWDDFTPLATVYGEYTVFYVKPDSPIQTGQDLVAKLQEDPASLSIGGSANGGASQLGLAVFVQALGIQPSELTYVPYEADEAIPAVMGGQIDVATSGSESMDLVTSGELKAIAVSAEEPLTGRLEGVPIFKEAGSDSSFVNYRLVSGPPDMPAEAVAYWREALTKMNDTQEWKDALERNGWSPFFQADGVDQFYQEDHAAMVQLFKDLGLT